jgi:hypothetical protein
VMVTGLTPSVKTLTTVQQCTIQFQKLLRSIRNHMDPIHYSTSRNRQAESVLTSVRCRLRPLMNCREFCSVKCIKTQLQSTRVIFNGPEGLENTFVFDSVYGKFKYSVTDFEFLTENLTWWYAWIIPVPKASCMWINEQMRMFLSMLYLMTSLTLWMLS